MIELLQQLMHSLRFWLPYLPIIAFAAGFLVAVWHVRRQPLLACLAAAAFALLFISELGSLVSLYLIIKGYASIRENEAIRHGIDGCLLMMQLTAWILLLFALFHRGDPSPAPATNEAGDAKLQFANFFPRLQAFCIDYVLSSVAATIPVLASGAVIFLLFGDDGILLAYVIMSGMDMLIRWLYFAAMESSAWQATLGKRLVGVKVANLDGGRISLGRATARYFSKILSCFFLLGFLAQLRTPKRQTWHDMIAGCVVITAGESRSAMIKSYSQERRGR